MSPKPANYSALPAYTTITAQSFTKDGLYLAVGNDQGRLAIFKGQLISECLFDILNFLNTQRKI